MPPVAVLESCQARGPSTVALRFHEAAIAGHRDPAISANSGARLRTDVCCLVLGTGMIQLHSRRQLGGLARGGLHWGDGDSQCGS